MVINKKKHVGKQIKIIQCVRSLVVGKLLGLELGRKDKG